MAAELGSYKQAAHTSPPPLTLGNSRVVEGPAPLKELGSRAQAMRVEVSPTISSQDWVVEAPCHDCHPNHIAPAPSWTFLRVVSLLGWKVGPRHFCHFCPRDPATRRSPASPQPQAWIQGGAPFNPLSKLSEDDLGYNKTPTLNDQVHVLVCVISASTVNILSDEHVKKMRGVRLEASDMGKGENSGFNTWYAQRGARLKDSSGLRRNPGGEVTTVPEERPERRGVQRGRHRPSAGRQRT
ncbi:hypothetical protein L3Q82_014288 [Scortum barcoo]|uniref:Uncharacterized protein n=1 Tax=Scortum barcoo TaxID=214431 RepID=A0ACB8VWW6_9TELE|nr:hypothetical protein L3Q82_014288 [Scortum barcoo]